MGIIKAALNSVGGALADQWLEIIEPDEMSDITVFAEGKKARSDSKRNSNKKGTEDIITDGSIIRVYPNQFIRFRTLQHHHCSTAISVIRSRNPSAELNSAEFLPAHRRCFISTSRR